METCEAGGTSSRLGIVSVQLGPCLFKNEGPNFLALGAAEAWLSAVFVDGHIVINDYGLEPAVEVELDLVYSNCIDLVGW